MLDTALSFFGLHSPLKFPAPVDSKVILFVGDVLAARLSRLAKWLSRSGRFYCVLLTTAEGAHKALGTGDFEQVFTYRSYAHLRALCRNLPRVDIIHAWGPKSYAVRIVMDSTKVPVVLDVQDLYVTNFRLNPPVLYMKLDLPHEKYVLGHAVGVISQSHEVYFARRVFGIPKVPSLFFPLYCDDDRTVDVDRTLDYGDIHIVYAGGIYGSSANSGLFGNMQFFELAEVFAAQQIHLHVYPSPTVATGVVREYEEFGSTNTFFHVHQTVPESALAQELSTYHFGILPFFNSGTDRDVAKRLYATSLKLFNYLEAGLPVIISRDMAFQSWLAGRFGAKIEVDEQMLRQLRSVIEAVDYSELQSELTRRRGTALISAHIQRLTYFYERVLQGSQTDKL